MPFGPILPAGDHVVLRPAVPGDRDARQALGIHADIARSFGAPDPVDRPMGGEEADLWFAMLDRPGWVTWVVEHEGTFVGTASLHSIEPGVNATHAIGLFDPARLSMGIGRAATGAVCRHAFEELDLQEIRLLVLDFNLRAQRSYEACGFVVAGSVPSDVMDGDRPAMDVVMHLTRQRWSARDAAI